MAGIYLHIPFCKQSCYYCNFHFTTSRLHQPAIVSALCLELQQRAKYLNDEEVETIYFGGGTPSLLSIDEIKRLLDNIHSLFHITSNAEITIETNPDDLDEDSLSNWKSIGINRLSIGIQSFFDEDLAWMNRAHNGVQAQKGLDIALRHYENITADLIYGSPGLTNEKWKSNVDRLIHSGIPHISCYALTVEQKTPLAKMIREKKMTDVDPDQQSEQFLLLIDWLEAADYEHYEISNFAKLGFRSRHNSSYWGSAPGKGKKYLGIGPSAHSFNGKERQWNVSNNNIYIRTINEGGGFAEKESLTAEQELNEYIMTALRTVEGIQLDALDSSAKAILLKDAEKFLNSGLLVNKNNSLVLTREGKLLADGIASDLFF